MHPTVGIRLLAAGGMRAVLTMYCESKSRAVVARDVVTGNRMAADRKMLGDAFVAVDDDGRKFFSGGIQILLAHKRAQSMENCGRESLAEPDHGV